MRLALITVATIIATLAADAQSVGAQESFFDRQYCMRGGSGRGGGGDLDCAFNTWQQCVATARGLGRYCTENPWWRGDNRSRSDGATQRKSRQRAGN